MKKLCETTKHCYDAFVNKRWKNRQREKNNFNVIKYNTITTHGCVYCGKR